MDESFNGTLHVFSESVLNFPLKSEYNSFFFSLLLN